MKINVQTSVLRKRVNYAAGQVTHDAYASTSSKTCPTAIRPSSATAACGSPVAAPRPEGGSALGVRQRLFVARELFKQPNLLLLDEATSALDTESERYIQQSIDDLQGEVTVVIIAHRLSTIKNVDYIYVLDEGRVIEQGSYDELRGHEASRFREMVEMQSL